MNAEDVAKISIPLDAFVEQVAIKAAWTVIKEHTGTCPISRMEDRVRILETRFNILLGAIVGSGALGGAVGAGVLKLLGG